MSYGDDALVVCDRLVRIYAAEGIEVQPLQGLDLLIKEGELTAMVGASGSGKSTLMNILAGLDAPTAGTVRVAGHDLAAMSARERLSYRRDVVGFIWQQTSRNLLPYLTAGQNVTLPMRLRGAGRRARDVTCTIGQGQLTALVGRSGSGKTTLLNVIGGLDRPTSGTVTVAGKDVTAMSERERLLFRRTSVAFIFQSFGHGRQIMRLLRTVVRSEGITALVATHDPVLIELADHTLRLEDGVLTTALLVPLSRCPAGADRAHWRFASLRGGG